MKNIKKLFDQIAKKLDGAVISLDLNKDNTVKNALLLVEYEFNTEEVYRNDALIETCKYVESQESQITMKLICDEMQTTEQSVYKELQHSYKEKIANMIIKELEDNDFRDDLLDSLNNIEFKISYINYAKEFIKIYNRLK
jgi:hypothetical protein